MMSSRRLILAYQAPDHPGHGGQEDDEGEEGEDEVVGHLGREAGDVVLLVLLGHRLGDDRPLDLAELHPTLPVPLEGDPSMVGGNICATRDAGAASARGAARGPAWLRGLSALCGCRGAALAAVDGVAALLDRLARFAGGAAGDGTGGLAAACGHRRGVGVGRAAIALPSLALLPFPGRNGATGLRWGAIRPGVAGRSRWALPLRLPSCRRRGQVPCQALPARPQAAGSCQGTAGMDSNSTTVSRASLISLPGRRCSRSASERARSAEWAETAVRRQGSFPVLPARA